MSRDVTKISRIPQPCPVCAFRTRARFPRPVGTKGARSLGTLFTAGRLAGRGLELLVVCLAVVLVALVFSGVPWAAFGIAGLFLAGCGRARRTPVLSPIKETASSDASELSS